MGITTLIVIDTHVLIWWISNPEKLSKKALLLIDKEMNRGIIYVSSISVWEIYLLAKKDRLQFSIDIDTWITNIESLSFVQFVPVDNKIAAKSVSLPGEFHADPADRIIVATTREIGTTLITSDERIQKYPHVQTTW